MPITKMDLEPNSLSHTVCYPPGRPSVSAQAPEDGAAGDTSNPNLGDKLAPSTDCSCLKNHLAQGSTRLSGAR